MKLKYLLGIILGAVCVLLSPHQCSANSLSYIPPESVTGVPDEIYQNAEIIGNNFNICPELLCAIAERESQFVADAENGNCKGLMQVSIGCHKQRFLDEDWEVTSWNDPYRNMFVAAEYLHELFLEYEDAATVLMIYHGENGWEISNQAP